MLNVGLVDEDWYLAHYPDVATAVSAGQFPSGEHHYVGWGILEDRLPRKPQVDEAFYLDAYPDVVAAVRSGEYASGYEHYLRDGRREGRRTSADE